MTREERFWAKVDKNGPIPQDRPDLGPCWLWTAALSTLGYGNFWDGERVICAHLFLVGSAPKGFDRDHLCRTPACIRPSHLELVTHQENLNRGAGLSHVTKRTGVCKQGHSQQEHGYTYKGKTRCRLCASAYTSTYRNKNREAYNSYMKTYQKQQRALKKVAC